MLSGLLSFSPWKHFVNKSMRLICRSSNTSDPLAIFDFSFRLKEFIKHLLWWFRRRARVHLVIFHARRRLVLQARVLIFLCLVLFILLLFFHLISNDLQEFKYTLKVILFNFIIHIRILVPGLSLCSNLAILILIGLGSSFESILKILYRLRITIATTILNHFHHVLSYICFLRLLLSFLSLNIKIIVVKFYYYYII